MSPELKQWLLQREQYLELRRNICEAGGHIMLRSETYDPEQLQEPLRTEAINYLTVLGEINSKSSDYQGSVKLN